MKDIDGRTEKININVTTDPRSFISRITKTSTKLKKCHARSAANARERSRMRVLSKAFNRLKNSLPWVPPDTKLSKLDTLRLALTYISHLQSILEAEESEVDDSKTILHQYVLEADVSSLKLLTAFLTSFLLDFQ